MFILRYDNSGTDGGSRSDQEDTSRHSPCHVTTDSLSPESTLPSCPVQGDLLNNVSDPSHEFQESSSPATLSPTTHQKPVINLSSDLFPRSAITSVDEPPINVTTSDNKLSSTPISINNCLISILDPIPQISKGGLTLTAPRLSDKKSKATKTKFAPMDRREPKQSKPVEIMMKKHPPPSVPIVPKHGSVFALVPSHLLKTPLTAFKTPLTAPQVQSVGNATVYLTQNNQTRKLPYCKQCRKTFVDQAALNEHYENLYHCSLCKIAFCVKEHFENHNEFNHPDGEKSAWGDLCESCGRVFGVVFQLDQHRIKCSNRLTLRCPRCYYSFGFEEDLKRHKAEHGMIKMEICFTCGRKFANPGALNRHRTRRIQSGGPFKCKTCSQVHCIRFMFESHLKTHFAKNWDKKPICTFCNQQFTTKKEQVDHERLYHANVCPFCQVVFPNAEQFEYHSRTCSKTFEETVEHMAHVKYLEGMVTEMTELIDSMP